MKPHFLNVDLEIEAAWGLNSLVTALGKRVVVLRHGPAATAKRQLLTLESSREHSGPDATIRALCAAVESLPPAARRAWNSARKVFDVGYELDPSERCSQFTLRAATLRRVADLGAFLAVSCYPAELENENRELASAPQPPDAG